MTKKEINILIAAGEGLNLEFKRRMDSRHADTLVAFANATGGQLLLGVEDDRTISGYTLSNELKSQIEGVARNCDPPVNIELQEVQMDNGVAVTVISIPPSGQGPYRSTNGF